MWMAEGRGGSSLASGLAASWLAASFRGFGFSLTKVGPSFLRSLRLSEPLSD